jgi:DNA-directed RNA polymerase omega subunit
MEGSRLYKLPEDLVNKYSFVTLASKRAEQLQAGALPRIQGPPRKVTVVAQQEVAEGLVQAVEPEELEALTAEEE